MNLLLKKFGNDKRWVNWQFQERKDGKKTKVPYNIDGKLASSVNPADWATAKEALKVSENIGIVFTPAQDLLGIDIDHCLKDNKITHEQKEQIAELILEADTYTEISPSGEGLHLFLSLSEPFVLEANKKEPFECYTAGRYFTFTGRNYGKESREVRTVSKKEALKILAIIGYPWKEDVNKPALLVDNKVDNVNKLDDSQILEKMFASKNGQKIRELYETAKGNSEDDMALCSYLAFWTAKDAEQMDRLWLASPLGNRQKTKKRKDYRLRTITNAIKSCKDVYEMSPAVKAKSIIAQFNLDLLYIIDVKGNKTYLQNTENVCRILRRHPEFSNKLRYDKFKNTLEINEIDTWRGIEDNDAVNIQTQIQIVFPNFGLIGKNMVYDAMIKIAKENSIDSASDFIKSLVWDKVSRLDTWLTEVYGVEDNVYHKAVGSNWLKGLVKRIIEPGCKFDYVLVLEGPQGSKKSTSLSILGGGWHVETTMSTDSKDFFMQFSGKAIIEFSEGETLNRTEVKKMKAIITMQNDKYRPPYERTSQDFPRRCVFAMTTNQEQYLKDETGNRRWLPLSVVKEEADVEWLEKNRDQLFAESYHRVITLKETVYQFPKEETLAAQNARRIEDANTDTIAHWYQNKLTEADRKVGVTIHQVWRDVLGGSFNSKPMGKFDEMNIASVLHGGIGLIRKQKMQDGVRSWRWFRTTDKDSILSEVDMGEEIKRLENDF